MPKKATKAAPTAASKSTKAAKRARDVTRSIPRARFAATLRRLADAIESGEPFRVQVGAERVVIPRTARPSVEHERAGGEHELELQLRWRDD